MEFGREAVAEHLVKNKIPKLENLKLDLSGAIDGMMDFNTKLDEIARDIRDKKNNAMAMEFVKVIGGMLVENGVSLKIEECRDENIEMNMAKNKIEVKYNVRIDGLDFSEHDKQFKERIGFLTRKNEKLFDENASLKQRIAELESGLNETEKMKSHWIDRAVEWQQKCEKLESEKSEKPVAYVLAKEIDGQHYVTVEDFMSVVNNLQ